MDQAREEHQQRERELSQLQTIAVGVEEVTSDGEITLEEIEKLRTELKRLQAIAKMSYEPSFGIILDPEVPQIIAF